MRFKLLVILPLLALPARAGEVAAIKREVYVPNKYPGQAPWVWVFSGKDGYREEIHTVWSHEHQKRGYGDSPSDPRRRISHNDGQTWTALKPLPPLMNFREQVSVLDWKFCGIHDPASDRQVALSILHVRDLRQGPPRRLYNHSFIRSSADGGRTFGDPQLLRYEAGADYDPQDVLNPSFLTNNTAYPGQSIFRHSNGSLIVPVCNVRIPAHVPDRPLGRTVWPTEGTSGARCFIGRWTGESYEWKAGQPVWLARELAYNGLLEPDVAELRDGRVLMIFRVTKYQDGPAYKWFSVSADGGFTFTQPQPFCYHGGENFHSPSTFHRLFRSSKTGKLYWLGNIAKEKPTNAGHPRYPLIIGEVNETTLGLRQETVTQIDTRRPGEGKMMQLSNFWIIEHSKTKELEIYLTRLYENPAEIFTANCYKYTLTFR